MGSVARMIPSALSAGDMNAVFLSFGIVIVILLLVIIVMISRNKPAREQAPATVEISSSRDEDGGAAVAAITAALAVVGEREGRVFKLISFRRSRASTAWGRAGRQSVINSHE